jgi:hypothetical protein
MFSAPNAYEAKTTDGSEKSQTLRHTRTSSDLAGASPRFDDPVIPQSKQWLIASPVLVTKTGPTALAQSSDASGPACTEHAQNS